MGRRPTCAKSIDKGSKTELSSPPAFRTAFAIERMRRKFSWAACSKVAHDPPHLFVVTHEENLQSLRMGAEQEADLQARAAFKNVLSQPPDGDSGMEVRLAEAVGQDSQSLLHTDYIRQAQVLDRGQKAWAEQDGGFSHVSVFQ